jgi:hypothetical protein
MHGQEGAEYLSKETTAPFPPLSQPVQENNFKLICLTLTRSALRLSLHFCLFHASLTTFVIQ